MGAVGIGPPMRIANQAINLEDLPEIERISLSTIKRFEPVNNSIATVKTSIALLSSEREEVVRDNKECSVFCRIESTEVYSCDICKTPVNEIKVTERISPLANGYFDVNVLLNTGYFHLTRHSPTTDFTALAALQPAIIATIQLHWCAKLKQQVGLLP
ncbi:hypothetical protein TNCV_231471 [Trichonephila clavipes]|nr:hypothetical protein TNCV_231471 [Trichonephila clavipes]